MLEKHIAHLFFKGLPLQPAFGSVYIVSSYGSHDAMSLQTCRFLTLQTLSSPFADHFSFRC